MVFKMKRGSTTRRDPVRIDGGYLVEFYYDKLLLDAVSVMPGESINDPGIDYVDGYEVKGWMTHDLISVTISFPYTPTGDVKLYTKLS